MTETDPAERPVRVGIALVDRDGRFLIRQRLPGNPMAGFWEFPGGKCEAGETPAEATRRECLEEIGLDVIPGGLRRRIVHRYPHAWVELSFFDCITASPDAEPDPASGFRWVAAADLPAHTFPEGNASVLEDLVRESRTGLKS